MEGPKRRPRAREDPGPAQTQARLERSETFILNRVPESVDPRGLVLFEQAVVFGAACVNGGAARRRAASPPAGAALRLQDTVF